MRWTEEGDGQVRDSFTGEVSTCTDSTLLTYANAWQAFTEAINSGDQCVDDVLAAAGLDED